MDYDKGSIALLLKKNKIIDVVKSYGLKIWYSSGKCCIPCPFHKEKEKSFFIDEGTQTFYCYGCGAGGNAITFVMMMDDCSFDEAVQKLAKRVGISICKRTEKRGTVESHAKDILKDSAIFYFNNLHEKDNAGIQYIKGRQISDDVSTAFGLGYAGEFGASLTNYLIDKGYELNDIVKIGLAKEKDESHYDAFWNRVVYPIVDVKNNVVGFGGRVMDDSKPKYLNSSESELFNKRKLLYGLNFAQHTKKDYFILCEGYMDVIALHQAGFNNAVASLGTALTKNQAKLLKEYTDMVCLAYDSDDPGVMAAKRAINILNEVGIKTKVIRMNPYKDPDEFIKAMGNAEFEKRVEVATDSMTFVIESMRQNCDEHRFYEEASNLLLDFL